MTIRWKQPPPKRKPKIGDTRVVRRFLWWPTVLGGEGRWLGMHRVVQVAYEGWCQPPEMRGYKCLRWRNTEWLDK